MPPKLTVARIPEYLNTVSVVRDGDTYRCKRCDAEWAFTGEFGWWQCPRPRCRASFPDFPLGRAAARMLDKNPPKPYAAYSAIPDSRRLSGRPKGSGDFKASDIRRVVAELWPDSSRRPTREQVAQRLATTVDTIDATLRREQMSFMAIVDQVRSEAH
jgi:hypothetical protein